MAVHHDNMNTDRLILQPLEGKDAAFIFSLVNTEGWLKFIGDRNVHSLKDAENYINKILNSENIFYWTVQNKENKTTIGLVTFLKRGYLDHFDLGFAFLPRFSNQGYAYEASKAILDFARQQLQHDTIAATTVPTNINSIKLLKKLGFVFLKELEQNKELLHVYIRE